MCSNTSRRVASQGKKDLSCDLQGTLAKLDTSNILNEQSMSNSLSSCELNDSLSYINNVIIESIHTLVDPIDGRIDPSCKIDLCPPSVDTCELNDSM